LADDPVAAETTEEVAERRGDGQDWGAGVEVEQRLLLYRINIYTARPCIREGEEFPLHVLPGSADT